MAVRPETPGTDMTEITYGRINRQYIAMTEDEVWRFLAAHDLIA